MAEGGSGLSKFFLVLLLAALVGIGVYLGPDLLDQHKKVGILENVLLLPSDLNFKAKIDTGATTSSIHAENIQKFQQNGKDWVRFTVINKKGVKLDFEKPVARIANVKRAGAGVDERFVVKIGVCVGKIFNETEFTLKNRQNMSTNMLIGRNILSKNFVVDVSKQHLTKPNCSLPGTEMEKK